MVIALPYKTDVDSQSKLTLSWLYWKFTMFNSSTFHKKKKKKWKSESVDSGFYTLWEPEWRVLLLQLQVGLCSLTVADNSLPMRYSDLSTSSLDQHIWIENKKGIHNLYFTKYSWTKNKFYFYVTFTQLEKNLKWDGKVIKTLFKPHWK